MLATGQQSLRIARKQLPAHVVELDDWKRVTERSDRRRIQNRVNQRAARKRKRVGTKQGQSGASQDGLQLSSTQLPSNFSIETQANHAIINIWQMFYSAMELVPADRSRLVDFAQRLAPHFADMQRALTCFEYWLMGSPGRDCLFTLIQFNVFRSMVSNERDLGLPEACALDDDFVSPISDERFVEQKMPTPLRPTLLQKKKAHHPWIDLLPLPQMRDNLLRAEDRYDETELCAAILGCGSNSDGRTGLIVWGEAWDPTGWEFTEDFIRQWGWTLHGCEVALAATNFWRQRRGKKVLKFEV